MNTCTAVNSEQNTHCEHTPGAVGSLFIFAAAPGGQLGAMLKGLISVVVLKVEESAAGIQSLLVPRLEPSTFGLQVRLSNH